MSHLADRYLDCYRRVLALTREVDRPRTARLAKVSSLHRRPDRSRS